MCCITYTLCYTCPYIYVCTLYYTCYAGGNSDQLLIVTNKDGAKNNKLVQVSVTSLGGMICTYTHTEFTAYVTYKFA